MNKLLFLLCATLTAEAFAEFRLSERQVLPVRDRFAVKSALCAVRVGVDKDGVCVYN